MVLPRPDDGPRGDDRPRVLGVVGTFVLDRIVGLPAGGEPVEDLGGIAYALSAVAAALPDGWRAIPIARVGADAYPRVRRWLAATGLGSEGLVQVSEPNNRVELHYRETGNRTERLTGGVGGWPWPELAPRLSGCDAVLVNFIAGHETTLETAERLRRAFPGPVYADLHSLFLGTAADGTRVPRPLQEWPRWVACFDAVQVNGDELDLLRGDADTDAAVRLTLALGPAMVACTLGERGAVCWWTPEVRWRFGPRGARPGSGTMEDTPPAPASGGSPGDGSIRKREIPARVVEGADPTGCGDVWGATLCCRLLAGDDMAQAAAVATRLASASAGRSGVDGLPARLTEILKSHADGARETNGGEEP